MSYSRMALALTFLQTLQSIQRLPRMYTAIITEFSDSFPCTLQLALAQIKATFSLFEVSQRLIISNC
jgi:hypothetical protein